MFQIKNRLKKMENRVGILKQGTIVVLPGENKESKLSEYKKKFPGAPPPKVIAVQFVKSMTGIERSEAKAS
jgi:hypothetical protein